MRTHCSKGHEFTSENTGHSRKSRYCLACRRIASRLAQQSWRLRNPEQSERTSKNSSARQILKNHGLTAQEYSVMLEKQAGLCAICTKVNQNGRKLAIDHNHTTGKIRGLLCSNCNVGLGHFKDNLKLLSRAGSYLQVYLD
jgi:hypothetical protein